VVQRDRLHTDHASGSGGEFRDRCSKSCRHWSRLPEPVSRSHIPHADETLLRLECPGYRELRSRAGGWEASGQEVEILVMKHVWTGTSKGAMNTDFARERSAKSYVKAGRTGNDSSTEIIGFSRQNRRPWKAIPSCVTAYFQCLIDCHLHWIIRCYLRTESDFCHSRDIDNLHTSRQSSSRISFVLLIFTNMISLTWKHRKIRSKKEK